MYTWYCPVGGLEYRCLCVVGWRIKHYLTVDGKQWAKMVKPIDSKEKLSCLN